MGRTEGSKGYPMRGQSVVSALCLALALRLAVSIPRQPSLSWYYR
jgi:hypothetical protein